MRELVIITRISLIKKSLLRCLTYFREKAPAFSTKQTLSTLSLSLFNFLIYPNSVSLAIVLDARFDPTLFVKVPPNH